MSGTDENTEDLDSAWDDDEEGAPAAVSSSSAPVSDDLDAGWDDEDGESPSAPLEPANRVRRPHRPRKNQQANASAKPPVKAAGGAAPAPVLTKRERRELERRGRSHATKRHRERREVEKAARRELAKQEQLDRETERRKALKARAKAEKKRKRLADERKLERPAVARKPAVVSASSSALPLASKRRGVLTPVQIGIVVVALLGLAAFLVWRLKGF